MARRPVSGLILLAGLVAGCTGQLHAPEGGGPSDGDGEDDGQVQCAADENRAPATPAVMAPEPDRIDVIPGALVIEASAFSDPDAVDSHEESAFEIWRTAGGEPVIRVWSATVTEPSLLTRVTLADGTFEVGETLDDWADYQVVARYRDGATCSAWSEWSPPRGFRTDDGSSYWFDPSAIRDVQLEIPQASWDAINAQAVPPGGCVPFLREYYTGSAVLDGQRYDGAGVRTKGGCGSARTLEGKASFKLNLSWNDLADPGCPAERRSHGLKRLTLNNMVQDRSYVHERLAYRLYQLMNVPTPRASHARVFVNGELFGLYANVESIDRRFLSRWFDSNDGMLYEGTYSCDLVPGNVPPADEDTFCLSRKFHPNECEPAAKDGDPEDYTPLRAMVQELDALVQSLGGDPPGSFYPEVGAIIDFETFLSMWAVETIIGHWDGYAIRIVNNYRIYHDPSTDLWTIIPTGVDQSFVEHTALTELTGLLAKRCSEDAECQVAFLARLTQALDVFEQADLGSLAGTIRAQIDAAVAEDPRKEGSHDEFLNQVNQTITYIDGRAAEIRAAMPP